MLDMLLLARTLQLDDILMLSMLRVIRRTPNATCDRAPRARATHQRMQMTDSTHHTATTNPLAQLRIARRKPVAALIGATAGLVPVGVFELGHYELTSWSPGRLPQGGDRLRRAPVLGADRAGLVERHVRLARQGD